MAAPNIYSTVITWVKIILPLLALALLSTLFLFSNAPDPERAIPFAEVDVEELAREQRLGAPRFAGTLEDGREVLFVAEAATPVPGEVNRISATAVQARLALNEADFMIMSAAEALLDLGESTADLGGEVLVTRSDGMRLATDRLVVSLRVLSLTAPGPVSVNGPGLDLTAGAMELRGESGAQVLVFNEGVQVVYEPDR